jgi:hypothetical protein
VNAYRTHPQCLITAMPDGTGVVLHLDTKFYFTLNATAVFVWQRIADGSARTLPALVDAVVAAFRVEADAAERDVRVLLDELVRDGLAQVGP